LSIIWTPAVSSDRLDRIVLPVSVKLTVIDPPIISSVLAPRGKNINDQERTILINHFTLSDLFFDMPQTYHAIDQVFDYSAAALIEAS